MKQFNETMGKVAAVVRQIAGLVLLAIIMWGALRFYGPISVGPKLTAVELGWLAGALLGVTWSK